MVALACTPSTSEVEGRSRSSKFEVNRGTCLIELPYNKNAPFPTIFCGHGHMLLQERIQIQSGMKILSACEKKSLMTSVSSKRGIVLEMCFVLLLSAVDRS